MTRERPTMTEIPRPRRELRPADRMPAVVPRSRVMTGAVRHDLAAMQARFRADREARESIPHGGRGEEGTP
jgi:hypothetical protein